MNFFAFASLLLVLSMIVFTKGMNPLPGGVTDVDVCSADIQELASIAVKSHFRDSHDGYNLKAVVSAKKQVVAGEKTIMQLKICKKSDPEYCKTCDVETVEQSWLKDFKVTKFECVRLIGAHKPN